MLEKLVLTNFQIHKKFVLELDPLCTTIVGPNDKGKSTIIRALRLVCFNPTVKWEKVVSWDETKCSVLLLADGHRVKREKGKSVNLYWLDGKRFSSDQDWRTIPPAIAKVLNVSDANFQFQLDSHFWFGESSGEVSRRLNEIINLGSIDRTLANVASTLRKVNSEIEVTTERLTKAQEEKIELSWVPEFDANLIKVEQAEQRHVKNSWKAGLLRELVVTGVSLQDDVERLGEAKEQGLKLLRAEDTYYCAQERTQHLRRVLTDVVHHKAVAKVPVPDDLDAVLAVRNEADKVAERRRNLEALLDELTKAKLAYNTVKLELDQTEQSIFSLGVCPLCQTKLTEPGRIKNLKPLPYSSATYIYPTSPP